MTGSCAFEPPKSVRGINALIVLWFLRIVWHWGIIEGKRLLRFKGLSRTFFSSVVGWRAVIQLRGGPGRLADGAMFCGATAFESTRRQGAPNDSTRKRLALSPSGHLFASKPAFAMRWRTNARASGTWRQTLGRNRARRLPAASIRPS